jgi:GAF domain-containing protein
MAAEVIATPVKRQRTIAELEAELEQRTAERDEALAQQTATAEVLRVINSSPGDLASVFDAILEKAHSLCGTQLGTLFTYDGERFWPAATHHAPPEEFNKLMRDGFLPSPGHPLARVIEGEPLVHIDDIRRVVAQCPDDPGLRVAAEGGIRTFLVVPLRKDNVILGAISSLRREVMPFTDRHIALLQNFAAQAVIAMENARLITETREALEQQTATADVLRVINSSPGDLAPVFDAILEKAHSLCDASLGYLLIRREEEFHVAATHGEPRLIEVWQKQGPFRPPEGTALGRVVRGERIVHLADAMAYDGYRDAPVFQRAAEASGLRTLLLVPLRKDDALLGAISAGRKEVRPFSDQQIALLENFAAQAVIAMENARLLTETREALEQQTATAEVLQVINSSPGNLTPVFDAILEKAHSLCGAELGVLFTYDGERLWPVALHDVAAHDAPAAFSELMRKGFRPDPDNPLARVIDGEPLVHIVDIRQLATQRPDDLGLRVGVEAGLRTFLAVPLLKDDVLLGAISAVRREVRPFTDKQIALLRNFAAQAVIAMENARLLTETREALEQQTATAEVLQVINSSPGDLAPVFDAMLDRAMHLCEAAFGTLWTYDETSFHAAALHRVPKAYAEVQSGVPVPTRPGSVLGKIAAGSAYAQILDAAADESYRSPTARALVELGGARTVAGVALRKDEALLGAITIYRQEVKLFSDKQIALLQNFAAQAVIAMENARLITETREALEQQTATAEVLQVINSSPGDLQPVFETILEKAHSLCDSNHGSLFLREGEHFHAASIRGVAEPFAERLRRGFRGSDTPVSRRLLAGERFVHVAHLATLDHPMARAAVEAGNRTLLSVPLRKDETLLGMIVATRSEIRPFADKQIALLQNFAAQAVIAMENARLVGELRQRTNEVAELNRGLEARVAEQVEELGRVGRLKRFLAPQLAELIVSQGNEKILESHRREIVVVFCDLRGYTAFTETAEPEEVLEFLREYHGALGPLVAQFEGTLDQFSGDGIMVFFNDPVPCPDPAERAVKMAMAMREAAGKLITDWRRHSYELGFGAGIAQGYATLGQIGFSERSGYTAIGTVCNLAARLCAEAKDGQILVSSRIAGAVEAVARLEDLGNLELKGLRRPVAAFNVIQLTSKAPD